MARQQEASYTSTPAPAIPRPKCSRCEDWTTVIHKGNVISPCPVCRPAEYAVWLADGGRVPRA